MESRSETITRALNEWSAGDRSAGERVLPRLYDDLRERAAAQMADERSAHTLQPTALVHEAFLRLHALDGAAHWESREHFLRTAARFMRRILVDQARRHEAEKRGRRPLRVSLDTAEADAAGEEGARGPRLRALDAALERLAERDEFAASVVELRFFGSLEMRDVARALDAPLRRTERAWRFARAWLHDAIGRDEADGLRPTA